MAKKPDYLADYVEVNERIMRFHERYPGGSMQSEYEFVYSEKEGNVVIVKAFAYRHPDDKRPGMGLASEPVPGKSPYTKDSELMNAETSAWGRALAGLGFHVKRSVASKEEVRNRAEAETPNPEPAPAPEPDMSSPAQSDNGTLPDQLKSDILGAYNAIVEQMNKNDADRIVRMKLAELGVEGLEQMDEPQAMEFYDFLKGVVEDG